MSVKTSSKKALFGLMAATYLLGGVGAITPSYLNAATINQQAMTGKSVKIKDTVLTFGEIKQDAKGLYAEITLDRVSGIPQDIKQISILNEQGKVQLNGKNYGVYISVRDNTLKRVSDTQLQGKVNLIMRSDQEKNIKTITPQMLKGKTISISINEILYYANAASTGVEFEKLLKSVPKVQGVSLKATGFEFLQGEADCKLKNVLPAKGLNVPICDGSQSTIDNIGFVDGALQIRMKDPANEFIELHAVDQAGKKIKEIAAGEDSNFIYQYQIKDAATLVKCKFTVSGNKLVASDKEQKAFQYLA